MYCEQCKSIEEDDICEECGQATKSLQEVVEAYQKDPNSPFDFMISKKTHPFKETNHFLLICGYRNEGCDESVYITQYYHDGLREVLEIPDFVSFFVSSSDYDDDDLHFPCQTQIHKGEHLPKKITLGTNIELFYDDFQKIFPFFSLEQLDVSKVKDMSSMFKVAKIQGDLNLSGWDVSKIKDMSSMFKFAKIQGELNLSGWDVSKIKGMSSMFKFAKIQGDLNLSGWDVSKIKDMSSLFEDVSIEGDLNLSGWDVSEVKDMSSLFEDVSIEGELNLSGWDVSKVKDMSFMFEDADINSIIGLENWMVENVMDFSDMFKRCDLLALNIRNVTRKWGFHPNAKGIDSLSGKNHPIKKEKPATEMNQMIQNLGLFVEKFSL